MDLSSITSDVLRQLLLQTNGNNQELELESFGFFLKDYVIKGGAYTQIGPHKFELSELIISFADRLWKVYKKEFYVNTENTTYFIDFTADNGLIMNVVHPTVPYLPIGEINTVGFGIISSYVDRRGEMGYIKFTNEVEGLAVAYADTAGFTELCEVANLANTVPFGGVLSKPTTLAGYGITDATPISHIGSTGNAHGVAVAGGAAGFLSGADKTKLNNLEVGLTAAEKDQWNDKASKTTATQFLDGLMSFGDKAKLDTVEVGLTAVEKAVWNAKASTAAATTAANGLMTAADKTKLNGIDSLAEVNQNAFTRVKVSGQLDVNSISQEDDLSFSGGTGITVSTNPAARLVTITATGTSTPGPHATAHVSGGTDVIPDAVSNIASGLMSASDKAKLDTVQMGATNYVHPANHPPSIIAQNASNRFVSDAQITAWDGKANTDSPNLTGTPTVPTAAAGTSTAQAASTAFVSNAVSSGVAMKAKANDQLIGSTTQTTIASFTPTSKDNYMVSVYFRVVTGTTNVTVSITYADGTGAQTTTLINAQVSAVGSYSLIPLYLNAAAGTPIAVKITASIANQVFASASIMGV